MKILICITGELRASEVTYNKFLDFLVEPNNADILISAPLWENNIYYDKAKYIVPINTDKPLIEYYHDECKQMHGNNNWHNIIIKKPGIWLGGLFPHRKGSGGFVYYYKYMAMKFINQLNLQNKYDFFVFTRSDQYYSSINHIEKIIDKSKNTDIWIPIGENYNGVYDRHWIVSTEAIMKCCNLLEPMFLRPDQLCINLRRPWNSEMYIRRVFDINNVNIERTIRQQFIVRGSSKSRKWSQGVYVQKYNVVAAYMSECRLAQ